MPEIQMIYGPPGTGKTNKLIELLRLELAIGVPKNKIAFVSFTNEGVDVGIARAQEAFGGEVDDYPYFRTLHSLAFRQLKLRYGQVMTKRHYRDMSRQLQMNFTGYYTDDVINNDDMYLRFEDLKRNSAGAAQVFLEEIEGTFDTDISAFVHTNYERYKAKYDLIDYTDMVEKFCSYGCPVPVDVVFIDEAQDLTDLQWRMVRVAFGDALRWYVAGDDDQAIFTWAGASVKHFLKLRSTMPAIYLQSSHRLPDNHVALAAKVIKQLAVRIDKPYSGRGVDGPLTFTDTFEVGKLKEGESYMFLARNRAFLKPVEQWLKEKGMVYSMCGAHSVDSRLLKRAKEWEEYRKTATTLPLLTTPLGQLIKKEAKLSEPFWEAFEGDLDDLHYTQKLIEQGTDAKAEPTIRISTIHRVKGAEADNVILLLDMARRTFVAYKKNPDPEIRVFYVGMTRARKALTLVHSKTKYSFELEGICG